MKKNIITLEVSGMDCNNCAMSITRYLERKGLEDVFVNFQTSEVRFREDEKVLSLEGVKGYSQAGVPGGRGGATPIMVDL